MGTGKFPDIIKLGKITPIFKKEDEQLLKFIAQYQLTRSCQQLSRQGPEHMAKEPKLRY